MCVSVFHITCPNLSPNRNNSKKREAFNSNHALKISWVDRVSLPVVIVNHDKRWPAIYEEEKLRILDVAGNRICGIEHIGSTAVLGLEAKPIVDIMAGVNSLSDAESLLPLLKNIGYEDAIRQHENPEWYYCLRKTIHGEEIWLQNFHLHLMKFNSETWKKHILFRDFLRSHPEHAVKYARLKRKLAAQHSADREGYTNAKAEFIVNVLDQAKDLK